MANIFSRVDKDITIFPPVPNIFWDFLAKLCSANGATVARLGARDVTERSKWSHLLARLRL
jgi:hypothetical protein